MNTKLANLVVCAVAIAGLPIISATQARAAPAAVNYKAPRNAFGQPDLTGTWTNTLTTKLERPVSFGDRLVMTDKEVADFVREAQTEKKAAGEPIAETDAALDSKCNAPGADPFDVNCRPDHVGSVPNAFLDAKDVVSRVNGQPRTSLITFPANGRIPYLPSVRDKMAAQKKAGDLADNPENLSLAVRCIVGQNTFMGAIMVPTIYNNTYVIQQSPDTVVIILEMSHEPRIIRLNAKHGTVPQYYGDSIGHYEGDTLVIETTNYNPEQLARNTAQLKVTERLTPVGKGRLLYQFKVEDPGAYSQPWGGEYEFRTSTERQYEYACHEGNYGLVGILQGARADEKAGHPHAVSSAE